MDHHVSCTRRRRERMILRAPSKNIAKKIISHRAATWLTNISSLCTVTSFKFADSMVKTVVIDGRGHLMGRLASTIAKELLNGT